MNNWNNVIESVLPHQSKRPETPTVTLPKRSTSALNKRYYINPTSPDLYLTQRELDCARQLLCGLTFRDVGKSLGISRRTVEFYVRNMRLKFECAHLKNLIVYLKTTGFFNA